MTNHYVICFLLTFLVPFATCNDTNDISRDQKLISTFQVVRFPNDGCVGSNSRNGTCYTSQECSNKGGNSAGSCADGFGVCCTFLVSTCGSSASENMTAWTSPTTVASGSCSLTVIPVSDDICSLRLDFTTFVITGPSTWSLPQVQRRLGHPAEDYATDSLANIGSTYTTNCHTDAFYSQGPSPSTNPPVVCGTLTASHMYLEADIDRGNKLMFVFADSAIADTEETITRGVATLATRSWDLTISHIECSSATLPPAGCTKYYWAAAGTATITNYNYATTTAAANVHLAQQHERICIRRERGKCVGCFSATAAISFEISNPNEGIAGHSTYTGGCCGYFTNHFANDAIVAANILTLGTWLDEGGQMGWDCVIIPGAFMPTTDANGAVDATQTTTLLSMVLGSATEYNAPSGPQICGNGAGIGPGVAILNEGTSALAADGPIADEGYANSLSVCTRNVPFMLEFMSDDLEGIGNIAADSEFGSATQDWNQGFQIGVAQLDC